MHRTRRPHASGRSTSSRQRARTCGSPGFARPVLQEKLIADGTVDQEALGKLGPTASGTPVQLTQEQITAAQEYLGANWNITIE